MAWFRDMRGRSSRQSSTVRPAQATRTRVFQAVFPERKRAGGDMALVLFDLLHVGGKSVMREPWRDRRKRLEDLVDGRQLARIAVMPVTDDAPTLYEAWVGMGGEGIVLKDPASLYRPGERSPAWLKLKPKLTLDVRAPGGSPGRIAWGDWGEAVMLQLAYNARRLLEESASPVGIMDVTNPTRSPPCKSGPVSPPCSTHAASCCDRPLLN